jgi:hypothetical protein
LALSNTTAASGFIKRYSMWFSTTEASGKSRGWAFRDGAQEESEPVDATAGEHSASSQAFCPLRSGLEAFAFPEPVPDCFATGAAWSLRLLRTDAVSLGFCISLWMLATIALPAAIECFLFVTIVRYINTDRPRLLLPQLQALRVNSSQQIHQVVLAPCPGFVSKFDQ